MPRPMNLILGEGTTKAQRWGLAGLGDINTYAASFGQMDYGPSTLTFNDIPTVNYWDWATGGSPNANATSMLDAAGNNLFNVGGGGSGTTVGSWLSKNMMLVAVGLGAVLLLRRR
jgi:hypothetical protein